MTILAMLGFETYGDYLQSSLWEWIKELLLEEPGANRCAACNSPTGLVWHHRYYTPAVLVGNFSNSPPVIVRLCGECHRAIHTDGKQWFEFEIVEARLKELFDRMRQAGAFRNDRHNLETNGEIAGDPMTLARKGLCTSKDGPRYDDFSSFEGKEF
jgi:hypothetical protein